MKAVLRPRCAFNLNGDVEKRGGVREAIEGLMRLSGYEVVLEPLSLRCNVEGHLTVVLKLERVTLDLPLGISFAGSIVRVAPHRQRGKRS